MRHSLLNKLRILKMQKQSSFFKQLTLVIFFLGLTLFTTFKLYAYPYGGSVTVTFNFYTQVYNPLLASVVSGPNYGSVAIQPSTTGNATISMSSAGVVSLGSNTLTCPEGSGSQCIEFMAGTSSLANVNITGQTSRTVNLSMPTTVTYNSNLKITPLINGTNPATVTLSTGGSYTLTNLAGSITITNIQSMPVQAYSIPITLTLSY